MATLIPMPMRNEQAAPTFDTSQPRELPHFFKDLEQLMDRAQIQHEIEKKKQVVQYVDFGTEQIWKMFPKFKNPNKTYENFKDAIMVHYPDATSDFVYSLRDLDSIIRIVLNVGGSRGVLTRLSWGFRNDWLLLNKSSLVYVEISGLGVYCSMRHEWGRGLTTSKSLLILLSGVERSNVGAAI